MYYTSRTKISEGKFLFGNRKIRLKYPNGYGKVFLLSIRDIPLAWKSYKLRMSN